MGKLSWNEVWMRVAKDIALRSGDPNTKVGAVLVDKENRVISTGYNGYSKGVKDKYQTFIKPEAYNYIIHAEMNCIAYARRPLVNATLYVSLYPCTQCAKLICATGIKKVVFEKHRPDEVSKKLFDMCGVKVIHYKTMEAKDARV